MHPRRAPHEALQKTVLLSLLIACSPAVVPAGNDPDPPAATTSGKKDPDAPQTKNEVKNRTRNKPANGKAAEVLPKKGVGLSTENIEITADSAEMTRSGSTKLTNAQVRQGDRQISADSIEYDGDAQNLRAKGSVEYSDPQLRIQGARGSYEAGGASFGDAEFEMPALPARGTAEEIAVTQRGRVSLKKLTYTSCPRGNEDWALKASSIVLDSETHNGTGRSVRLDFKGVPILYTPIISFPLDDRRKSGFLFPDFGHSSRNGVELSVPYYFNLAPNYDLTLTTGVLSSRGVRVLPEFRYIGPRRRGTLTGAFLADDRVHGGDRSFVKWDHRRDYAHDWRLNIDAANASDGNYFEDFGSDFEGTSVTFLERNAELTHYGRNWSLIAQAQSFQTIDQTIFEDLRPYSRLPRVVSRGFWDGKPGGFALGMQGEMVYFHRNDPDGAIGSGGLPLTELLRGGRLDVEPELTWSFTRPGLYVTPGLAYRQTQYALENTAVGAERSPTRGAPVASFDTGMTFERLHGSHDSRIQTLEPRLLYLYVPYREQSQLPVFDSGLPDLNLVQLFRRNRYVGADRLSDANQVSAGLTSRLLDTDSGRQYLSATLGQTYYFETPRVTLPGEIPPVRNTSNLVSQVELTAYRNWNVNLGYEWNPEESRSEKTELALQYRPGPQQVANVGYRFRRGLIEQVDSSLAWPLAKRWNLFARGVYSLRDDALIEQFAGFEYASCCWKLRFVQRRYVSDRTGERDTSFAVQLELKGLSSVGVPADAFLERSIRGYSRSDAGARSSVPATP